MRKLLRISRHEFFKIVGKRGFWVGTLAFPFMIVFFAGLAIFVMAVVGAEDTVDVIGYVDHAGVLDGAATTSVNGVEIRPYLNETSAQNGLQTQDIQAYYVLSADYLETHNVALYVQGNLPLTVESDFQSLLRPHILANTNEAIRTRVLDGADISIHTIDKVEEDDTQIEAGIRGGILFFAFFIVLFIVADVAGYSSMIVEDERDNRTLEMMMTTMTPTQFVVGKIIGLVGVTLTRPTIWLLMASPLMMALFAQIPPNYRQMIDWSFILLILLFLFPGILLFFGLMTSASLLVNDPRYSGQMGSLLSMTLFFSMIIGFSLIVEEENSVAVFFSFFPLTSFMVIVMRQTMTDVPFWQILLSWLILAGSAWGSLWLAVRFFRSGRLYTGRPFQWKSIWYKLRLRRSA